MAHTLQNEERIPPPPMSRPNAGLVGWAIFGLAVASLLAYGFLASRGPSLRSGESVTLEGTPGSIRTYGSIAELTRGDTGGKVNLSALPSGPGVVGLGSLSNARGEIAIVRGLRWLSYPETGNRMKVERAPSTGESAAFLALADVARWQEQRFDVKVPFERLAAELEQRASRAGLDTNRPFPLLVEGPLSNIELHVDGPAAPAAVRASVPSAQGSIVGFFAARGGERLVPAGERLHLHVVLPDREQVGHLDSAGVEPGALLRLPAPR